MNIREHARALLVAHIDASGESINSLAAKAGVSFNAIKRIKDGKDFQVSTWEKIEPCLSAGRKRKRLHVSSGGGKAPSTGRAA